MAILEQVRQRRVARSGKLGDMTDRVVDDRELASETHQGIDLFGVDLERARHHFRRRTASAAAAISAGVGSLSSCARAACKGCAESASRLCPVAREIRSDSSDRPQNRSAFAATAPAEPTLPAKLRGAPSPSSACCASMTPNT